MTQIIVPSAGLKPTPHRGGPNVAVVALGDTLTTPDGWQYVSLTSGNAKGKSGWLPSTSAGEPPEPVCLGAWTPNSAAPWNQSSAAAYTALFGTPPGIIHWYQDLVHSPAFDSARCDEVVASSAIPLISWELDDYTAGVVQPPYTNASFFSGTHDAALIAFLAAAGVWNKPFLLRPFWEMSGGFYPWGANLAPNTPGSFIDAWRYVARLVRLHAPLARLVWCPSIDLPGLLPLEDCYPGHAYVDVLGLDGYRKKPTDGGFQAIFQPSYARLTALAPGKPILIGEVGCCPCSDQAAWIAAIPDALRTMPAITALCYFNNSGQAADYRLTSDPATLAAWQTLAALPSMHGRL